MNDEQIAGLVDSLIAEWPKLQREANGMAVTHQDGELGDRFFRDRLLQLVQLHLVRPTAVVVEEDWSDLDPADMPRF